MSEINAFSWQLRMRTILIEGSRQAKKNATLKQPVKPIPALQAALFRLVHVFGSIRQPPYFVWPP
jgi:hypothetical protein